MGGRRLTLNSSASMLSYPDNESGDFTIRLPERVIESDNSEVSLTELILPNQIVNVRNTPTRGDDIKKNEVMIYRPKVLEIIDDKGDYNVAGYGDSLQYNTGWEIVHKIEVPEDCYDDWNEFVDIIHEKTSWDNWKDPEISTVHTAKQNAAIGKRIEFAYDKDSNRVTLTTRDVYGVRLGLDLESILGLSKKRFIEGDPSSQQYFCYFGIHKGTLHPYTKRLTDLIYVNTDISASVQMGDMWARCLRIVTAYSKRKNEQPGTISKTFKDVYYNKLFSNEFETVNIRLTDRFGETVRFHGSEVIVILHIQNKI